MQGAARRTRLVMMIGNLMLSSKIACESTQMIASMMVDARSFCSQDVSPSTKDWLELSSVTSSHTCDAMMILMTMMRWKM